MGRPPSDTPPSGDPLDNAPPDRATTEGVTPVGAQPASAHPNHARSIERAGPAHPIVLAAIHATAFPPGEAWSAAMFAAQLGLPGVFALVCQDGGVLVTRVAADEAEILTLAVIPPARRGGLGRALVQQAAAQARDAGAARLFLEVGSANAAARALYERCGFRPVGLRRRYYADGGDAVVMALDLTGGAAAGG